MRQSHRPSFFLAKPPATPDSAGYTSFPGLMSKGREPAVKLEHQRENRNPTEESRTSSGNFPAIIGFDEVAPTVIIGGSE